MFKKDSDTYDIYLLPPGEDVETCTSWLRMRNRDGRYNLMFEEWVTDGPFIISPRITFEVSLPTACRASEAHRLLQSHEVIKNALWSSPKVCVQLSTCLRAGSRRWVPAACCPLASCHTEDAASAGWSSISLLQLMALHIISS